MLGNPEFIYVPDTFHEIFVRVSRERRLYHLSMSHPRSPVDSRSLTVVLSESEWRALRAVEPDAVGWLQAQIRQRLDGAAPESKQAARPSAPKAGSWGEDLY
jgi:hypothetical protein